MNTEQLRISSEQPFPTIPAIREGVLNRYFSLQDMRNAYDLFSHLTNPGQQAHQGLELASAHVAADIDPHPLLEIVNNAASEIRNDREWNIDLIRTRLASLYAHIGEYDRAFEEAEHVRYRFATHPSPDGFMEIARAQIERKEDPTKALEKAVERVSALQADPQTQASEYLKLARLFHQGNRNPEPLLTEVSRLLPATRRDLHLYKATIPLYAQLGNLEAVEQLVEHYKGESPRRDYLIDHMNRIHAQILMEHGHETQAIAIMSHMHNPSELAEFYAFQAELETRRGIDPTDSLNTMIGITASYPENKTDEKIDLYCKAAIIYHAVGEDPQPIFDSISDMIHHLPSSEDKGEMLVKLASAQHAVGISTYETLESALSYGDRIVEEEKTTLAHSSMWSHFSLYDQAVLWKDIGEKAIQTGAFGVVDEAIQRLRDQPQPEEWENNNDLILELLCHRAAAYARLGLSQQEVDALTPQQIRIIAVGADPQIYEALKYFELDKKLKKSWP